MLRSSLSHAVSRSRSTSSLATLLSSAPERQVFEHIAQNATKMLQPPLVEQYLFRLLTQNNLNAATSLVHILYNANAKHYRLSNQFWSLLASSAATQAHHAAASLVFHEVVMPHTAINEKNGFENPDVPFLLLPTALEQLALVFVHAGNAEAVEGLRHYFRRFYSNLGHRDVYETLNVASVESLAKTGDMEGALEKYVELAFKYRGHSSYKDPKDAIHSLKYASHRNYKQRQENIQKNLRSQKNQKYQDGFLFDPNIVYNKYTIPGGNYWSILDGSLRVADLPYFHALLRSHIRKLIQEKHSVVDRLLSFISCHHHSLHRFVVAILCDLDCVEHAWAVMSKTPDLFPKLDAYVVYAGMDDFNYLFRALKQRLEMSPSKDALEILARSHALVQQVAGNRPFPYSVRSSYLSALLASSSTGKHDVERTIATWSKDTFPKVLLDDHSYKRLQNLDIEAKNFCVVL
ncbi:hypothetical protein EJF18_10820 [Clavispora lusitaniae]|uniref:Uncharacterized protein n=1 Tax=Clavispora lusitaniae TaxID=36911 RepID=A0ACD0WEF7_CLALS|nr:hypothetical protein EJF14_10820 [Clavispora lusitaniae]QFZ30982.1 hypothetical protein EJF16_10820 [Clavispora lusitaniae]QFZ36650.1 hypothetical protein EJF15_10820 [Clavispora lusitaniae]QFZ42334.1 hypothetical protein EJF18_10820 [Clavispora lusitaniae]QFZ48010.1 hypothetical protein EJF17_10820 [Clavispora lusitaniae]